MLPLTCTYVPRRTPDLWRQVPGPCQLHTGALEVRGATLWIDGRASLRTTFSVDAAG
jgi:hypothetical protein